MWKPTKKRMYKIRKAVQKLKETTAKKKPNFDEIQSAIDEVSKHHETNEQ